MKRETKLMYGTLDVTVLSIDTVPEALAFAKDTLQVPEKRIGDGRLYVGHYWSDHGEGVTPRWHGPFSRVKTAISDAIGSRYPG